MVRQTLDVILLSAVLVLLLFSVCFVYTASSAKAERDHGDHAFFLKRQLLRLVAGLILLALMVKLDYHRILQCSPAIFWITAALLIALLFAPPSWIVRGSRRWLMIGSFSLQPSELAKFGLIAYLSANLARPQVDLGKLTDGLLPQLILIAAVAIPVLLEPDMGTALVLCAVGLCILFVRGARLHHLFLLISSGVLVAVLMMWSVAYQRGRVESFIDSFTGKAEPAWQVKQSLIGLGTGGLTGLGLGKSKQKLLFLPDPFTDFIMSIIGEELGILGTLAVVALFLIIVWRGFRIAGRAPDDAGKLLAMGITLAIGLNAFINMAVVTNLLPTTGIPLPFVSYGGSSLLMNLIGVGILLNISSLGAGNKKAGTASVPLARVRWYRDQKR